MPGPMRSQQTPGGGELARLAQSWGIDVASLGAGGAAAGADPKDPPVYFGSGPREVRYPASPRFKPDKPRIADITKSLSQANAGFYELSESDLTKLQRRLVAAGILDPKRTRFGDYDDDTYSAYAAINERTARFNAVGKKFTPNDVLGMIEKSAIASGIGQGAAEQVEPGRVSETTNRLTLEQQVQAAARQNLGRKLKASEVSKFVTLFQGVEASRNARLASAEDAVQAGADVTVESPVGPDAAAERYVETNFAQEAAGQDAYGYLGALRDLLAG